MKYKVGDKVKVKEDLRVKGRYGEYFFVDDMREFSGKTLTIEEVYSNNYTVEENDYSWTDEMFEGLAESRSPQPFKVTNELLFKNILEPMGYKIGDKFTMMDYECSPLYINEDYYMVDKDGNATDIVIFPGENIVPYEEPKTKEEILKDLKKIKGDWKPCYGDNEGQYAVCYSVRDKKWGYMREKEETAHTLGAVYFHLHQVGTITEYLNRLSEEENKVLLQSKWSL